MQPVCPVCYPSCTTGNAGPAYVSQETDTLSETDCFCRTGLSASLQAPGWAHLEKTQLPDSASHVKKKGFFVRSGRCLISITCR